VILDLTEEERRFVLGAVKSWGGRHDPFTQGLLAKIEDCRKRAFVADNLTGDDPGDAAECSAPDVGCGGVEA
jgi:hypothetical protein